MNPISYVSNDFRHTQYSGTALVIDGDEIGQNILSRYLTALGFIVDKETYSVNPSKISNYIYNLIFITKQTNNGDAYLLAEKIRKLNSAQIIFLCSSTEEPNISKTGISGVVKKPLNQADIVEKINLYAPECCDNFDSAMPLEMISSESDIEDGLDFLENRMFNIFKERISQEIKSIEEESNVQKLKKTFHKLKSSYAQFGFIKSQDFFAKHSLEKTFTPKDLSYLKKQTLADITALTQWIEFQKKINKKDKT